MSQLIPHAPVGISHPSDFFTAERAEKTVRPLPATKNQFYHEGHEEHEGVLRMVLVTLRGLRVLRGYFLLSCYVFAARWATGNAVKILV